MQFVVITNGTCFGLYLFMIFSLKPTSHLSKKHECHLLMQIFLPEREIFFFLFYTFRVTGHQICDGSEIYFFLNLSSFEIFLNINSYLKYQICEDFEIYSLSKHWLFTMFLNRNSHVKYPVLLTFYCFTVDLVFIEIQVNLLVQFIQNFWIFHFFLCCVSLKSSLLVLPLVYHEGFIFHLCDFFFREFQIH